MTSPMNEPSSTWGGGGTCGVCGWFVPKGQMHYCVGTQSIGNPNQYPDQNQYLAAEHRTAAALERIAGILERIALALSASLLVTPHPRGAAPPGDCHQDDPTITNAAHLDLVERIPWVTP